LPLLYAGDIIFVGIARRIGEKTGAARVRKSRFLIFISKITQIYLIDLKIK